ncbi:MAG: hypothetical protein Q7J43_16820 [Pseudomonas sp.]|uniref:hypothetical protein n=1 Tax=Pseudomonas sp. TaxID=306 RepID=UPI00271698EA|nr:hypothetical protein [Pseudomonas sp.]MDO9619331.1 hypothetical protein [Pseudomonas sp.]MDP2446049.1 hypothetical protein [Pseudomonas sp.]MDZ4338336.1 hypothetical protein [Pseudomonas sp.]
MSGNRISPPLGVRAEAYASFRPHYPQSLLAWLAAQYPERLRAREQLLGYLRT